MNPEMTPERLRVGDAERDEVTSALHEHFAQGRLDREELDERLSAALSARTAGDLREVVRDLPGSAAIPVHGPEGHPSAHHTWGHGPWGRGPRGHRHGRYGPESYGPWGRGPFAYGGGSLATTDEDHGGPFAYGHGHPAYRGHRHAGPYGRGPRGKPFGLVLLAFVIAAAVTGGWVVFPFVAVVWLGGGFLVMRHARRWHHAAPRGR